MAATHPPLSLDSIRARIAAEFRPSALEVLDESHKHAGHAGRMGVAAGEITHIRLRIASDILAGMSRVAAHRAVHAAMKEAFSQGLHALAIEIARTPKEN